MLIDLVIGDITKQQNITAVVNAAKESLMGGGGVDGAIHRAAGPKLLQACKAFTILGSYRDIDYIGDVRCPTGDTRVTPAYDLPNEFVIHTVGPRYEEDGVYNSEAPKLLTNCYRHCMREAVNAGMESIAFPAISTGIYGYPLEAATIIAVKTVMEFKDEDINVRFVCFDEANWLVYKRVLDAAMKNWYAGFNPNKRKRI